jgi:hypothetical protein
MKKWRPTPPSADFWASVLMTVTGCPLTLPSEIIEESGEVIHVVTLNIDTVAIENAQPDPLEVSTS